MTANTSKQSTQPKRRVMTVDSDPEVIQILEVNLTHANLEVITARNGAEALLKASTERPDIIILDAALPDSDGAEICRQLKESQETSHIPIIIIGALSLNSDTKARTIDLADHYINKPFDPKEIVSLVRVYLKKMERVESINTMTGLPDQTQIYNEVTSLIEQNKTFAAMYVDMDNLNGFNKAYGFARGDLAIRLLSEILSEAVRLFGSPDDLAGHLGGDNFVIVSTIQEARMLCRRIIADFDSRIKSLYDQNDIERGYIEYEGRLGYKEQSPIMKLRIAVVTNDKRVFRHYLEVSEAAAEQIEYLRHLPRSCCYFDLRENVIEPQLSVISRDTQSVHRQELKTLQGVLAWVAFLTREIDIPITAINDCLDWLESASEGDFAPQQLNSLKTIRENTNQLLGILPELVNLVKSEWVTANSFIGEVNLKSVFDWILDQVNTLAKRRKIKIKVTGVENTGQLILDERILTQGLFYVLQSLIQISPSRSHVYVRASDNNEGDINIELISPNRFIPPQKLPLLSQAQLNGTLLVNQRNKFYIARVLLQSLGGKVTIESNKERGLIVTIVLPKRWESSMDDVNALLHAVDISRKETRNQLDNLSGLLSSCDSQIQSAASELLNNANSKIREILLLCNRSLFLANELNSRLEIQQDRLLQQEADQFTTTDALRTICREVAQLTEAGHLFDRESSQRVAKYASIIANEVKLISIDRQALLYASVLNDLGLVLSVEDMLEQGVALSREQAITIKGHFTFVSQAISQVGFLSRTLVFILHRYERYDGKGHLLGVKGINIPQAAKILAVADTFELITSGLSPWGKLSSRATAQKIADESGRRFDPDIVSAFLRAWRRREFHITSATRDIDNSYSAGKTSLKLKQKSH